MKIYSSHQQPLVSIITPTLNRARLLPDAIKSVLGQTFSDWEHIIVDDGSTDNTEDVVRKFTDNRIIYINRFKQRGISAARNLGLRLASGKYIAFLDSDDLLAPKSLSLRARFLEKHPRVALACGLMALQPSRSYLSARKKILGTAHPDTPNPDPDKIPALRKLYNHREKHHLLLQKNFVFTGTVMVRKSVIDTCHGFDERLVIFEDYDLWLRIARRYNIAFLNETLFYFRHFEDSIFLRAQKDKTVGKYYRLVQRKNRI